MSLHPCLRVVLLPLLLALATTHLVIVIDVAALALALCVDLALAGVSAVCRKGVPAVLVIAVIAHAHGVVRQISVSTRRDDTLFASRSAIYWLFRRYAVTVERHGAAAGGRGAGWLLVLAASVAAAQNFDRRHGHV